MRQKNVETCRREGKRENTKNRQPQKERDIEKGF